jgi:hypothetical protein
MVVGGSQSLKGVVCWSAVLQTDQLQRAKSKENKSVEMYSSAPVPTGNTFQDLPRLHETTDNTERYI